MVAIAAVEVVVLELSSLPDRSALHYELRFRLLESVTWLEVWERADWLGGDGSQEAVASLGHPSFQGPSPVS